jgi:diguanylate cyclase (GGDEF)-like protein/PAS domain S-box-containing protein
LGHWRRRTYALILLVTLLISAQIIWQVYRDYRQFSEFRQRSMQDATANAANQITQKLADLRTALGLFAEANDDLLRGLAASPNDQELFDRLSQRLGRHYPGYYALTLTDAQGHALYDDFGEKVGPLCQADIHTFTRDWTSHRPVIHPGPGRFHFDIMMPWGGEVRKGALFASFTPDMLATILLSNRRPDFSLALTHAEEPGLIEITDQGGRDRLAGMHHLSESRQAGISRPVPGTRWRIYALPTAAVLEEKRTASLQQGALSVGGLLAVALLMLVLLERERLGRDRAEADLRRANVDLESRVQSRTRELSQAKERLEWEIHERDQTEAVMRKLSTAVEQTDDAVVITDRNGHIEYVNQAFVRITGYSIQEALGQSFALLKSGYQPKELYEKLWATIQSGEPFREVMINRRKSGELFYEENTISPLKDGSGRITHFVSTGKDITDRMESQERLHFLAHHDVLTRLPNRTLFHDRLDHALNQARRTGSKLALMFIDLDGFKIINDSLSHAAGDALLQEVARRLQDSVRESDTVARLGGDEFTVILENQSGPEAAATVAQGILERITMPIDLAGQSVSVGASIGITLFPDDASDREGLISNADIAMYRAKEVGRGNYQFFTASLGASINQRLVMEQQLRQALERGEFSLRYQPKVALSDGQVLGMEALLRWTNAELGAVPPDRFIPVLEQTGLIIQVGDWVLEEACRFASALRDRGYSLGVAVNLSGRQVLDRRLPNRIEALLKSHGLRTNALEVEITETALIENMATAVETLACLGELGIKVFIDDFGTGYSSLVYLKRLPIDALKIDRAFVEDLPDDEEDVAITQAIIALARSLKMEVVAEGVETREQADFLAKRGCGQAQGFLFSQPLGSTDLMDWLASRNPSDLGRR